MASLRRTPEYRARPLNGPRAALAVPLLAPSDFSSGPGRFGNDLLLPIPQSALFELIEATGVDRFGLDFDDIDIEAVFQGNKYRRRVQRVHITHVIL